MILSIPPVTDGQLAFLGFGVVGLFLLGHLGKRLIDLWIDHMRPRPELLDEYADMEHLADSVRDEPVPYVGFDTPEVAPEDEPHWPGKVLHDSGARPLFSLVEQPIVLGGNPGEFDLTIFAPAGGAISTTPPETDAETSGRHALTESMPAVVDDDEPLAVVAAVSGQDGAS